MGNLLVVGAREGSLGSWVAQIAGQSGDWIVTTAGVSGEEDLTIDIANYINVEMMFDGEEPSWHSIVCTAGINYQGSITEENLDGQLLDSLEINVAGPLHLLNCWARWWQHYLDETLMQPVGSPHVSVGQPSVPMHFVAVSSNSAHIARSQSLAYCASKAALSMGIRCAARELASTWLNVWGVEPGWLSGTPMSSEVTDRLAGKWPHRIPGNRTVDPVALAHFIVGGLRNPHSSLNGCMIRMDGGEQ